MRGLIAAAGYGTRFLPVTKSIPKEMLPLIDTPTLEFIIDEFAAAGIKEVAVITSRRKKSMEDYFDHDIELESLFRREQAEAKLKMIQPKDISMVWIRQKEMLGTGHALLQAKSFIGDQPFICAYPDDIHFGSPCLSAQLIETYNQTGCCVLGSIHNPPGLERYGVLALAEDGLHVTDIVEKPPKGTEPSKEVSIGRYLYTPEIFKYLEEGWNLHTGPGEYFHIYALKKLMDQQKVVHRRITGERLDIGAPEGYLRAIIRYASARPELLPVLQEELKRITDG